MMFRCSSWSSRGGQAHQWPDAQVTVKVGAVAVRSSIRMRANASRPGRRVEGGLTNQPLIPEPPTSTRDRCSQNLRRRRLRPALLFGPPSIKAHRGDRSRHCSHVSAVLDVTSITTTRRCRANITARWRLVDGKRITRPTTVTATSTRGRSGWRRRELASRRCWCSPRDSDHGTAGHRQDRQ